MRGTHLTETDNWDGPFVTGPERKILYVCGSPQLAKDRWAEMGNPQNIRMGYPGMAVIGASFDEIILDEIYRDGKDIPIVRARISDWIEQLRCRLEPGARMRTIVKQRRIS